MLSSLYIRDFAIVGRLELSLQRGLSVVTGETGAGKSILIDALALVLGERADAGVIRQGAERAEIIATFDLDSRQDAAAWLAANDLFGDGECVVRRLLEREKPSKGFINGRPVAMQMLRELGEHLVDIHGQHEHQSLLKRDAQRQVLDDYAGIAERVTALGATYRELKSLQTRLESLQRESADREARIELLRYQVNELEAAQLEPDEIAGLESEHARLANAAELTAGVQEVAQGLYDDDEAAVTRMLARAIARLETLSEYDPKLAELNALLNEAAIRVDEAASQLHQYLDRLELDPRRLQWVEERLGTLHDLARKHRVPAPELPEVLRRLQVELGDIENAETNLARLAEQLGSSRAAYLELATTVSASRRAAALRLSEGVTAQMQGLGMAGGCFEIAVTPLDQTEPTAYGLDRIEFLVSANPGQSLRPLTKVASGGELSRFSLAIQVITAGIGRIPTLIFDEVDVGIGGGVAEIVGQQLRTLGQARQVLVITHLAQVAAQGEHHLVVVKRTAPDVAVSIRALATAERAHEIARMIGGVEITPQTLAHAQEMLQRAAG